MAFRNKRCQSCSMPLSKDRLGGGSEVDGRKSLVYCSYCYRNGAFIEPDITCEQMVEKIKGVFKQMGVPKILGWFFAKKIPKLDRWQK